MGSDEEGKALATPEFWDSRYDKADGENPTHEWFRSFAALRPFFQAHLFSDKPPQSNPRIVHLGSGDSTIPQDLAAGGYKNQLCLDFSQVVVNLMSSRHASEVGIEWRWADVRDMKDVPSGSVDVAFDKGTMDAMIHGSPWSPPEDVLDNTGRYIDEVHRVLKDDGMFLYVTYRQPHFIKPLLNRNNIWSLHMEYLTDDKSSFEYHGFILRKQSAAELYPADPKQLKTMKAARFYGKGDVRVEDVPKPDPRDDKVLIEVDWCGICGTDLHEYVLGPLVVPRKEHPHSITGEHLPVVLGHEFCGTIVKTASGSDLKLGDKVMVDPRINCQSCHPCRSNVEQLCNSWGFVGLSGGGGGFSEFVAVAPRMCYRVPNNVNMDEAALIEPLSVGRHALSVSGTMDFSNLNVLVVGGGPIGISVLWNLRTVGVKSTIVSEPTKLRQEQTKHLANTVLSPIDVNIGDECRKLTDGVGVDVVFDCAGVPVGMRAGMDALKARGIYVNVAGWEQSFVIPMEYAMMKEITIKLSMAYDNMDFKAVVDDFVAGKFAGAEKMITSRISLRDLPGQGFEELINNKDHHVKIVVTPKEELLAQAA